MDNCPTCQSTMLELSELTGMSIYDLLYWCQNCGTVAYNGGNEIGIYPSLLGRSVKHKNMPRFVVSRVLQVEESSLDKTPDEWIPVHVATASSLLSA